MSDVKEQIPARFGLNLDEEREIKMFGQPVADLRKWVADVTVGDRMWIYTGDTAQDKTVQLVLSMLSDAQELIELMRNNLARQKLNSVKLILMDTIKK